MFDNKKGAIGIIIFFSVLIIILVMGFVLVISWSIFDIASDEITPVMEGLGMMGDVNLSEAGEYSFGAANTITQALPWVIAFTYVLCLIFTLVFIYISGYSPHPAFIASYLGLMILMIFACVIMSNIYQDIYTGGDEVALRLQEQVTMSYLILHSPFIMALIAAVGGILMFGMGSINRNEPGGVF